MVNQSKMLQLFMAALMGMALTACDNAIFSSKNSNGNKIGNIADPTNPDDPGTPGDPGNPFINENGDLVFLDDSFEREDLFGDLDAGMIVGWRGAWDDNGTVGVGFTGDQLGMEIFTDQEMGPAFDGERATYFYGRPGTSIHRLWLVSPAYDLSDYNTVIMNYRYLTVALNDQADIDANYIEAIRLQVCAAGANECGANADFINVNNIGNSANWVTIAESDPSEADDVFDGTNHLVSDFITDLAVVDLNNPDFVADKSEFVIRFEVDLRDGFNTNAGSTNPDYDEEKCEKYTKKKKKYCDKAEHKCEKAERYQAECDADRGYGVQTLMTQTKRPSDHDCGKHRSCEKARHYAKKCEHYTNKCEKYTKKVEKYCEKGEEPSNDGTLLDGVILDLVQGVATERDISEIF